MLNETYRITPCNSFWCQLRWTVRDETLASWIILNGGQKTWGPIMTDARERTMRIPLASEDVLAIEVHDLPAEQFAQPVYVHPNTRPILRWNPVPGAVRYRIYHRSGLSPEQRIYDGLATVTEIRCPVELTGIGGAWHFLRVEAVDPFGNESTRQSWRFYACDLPRPPAALSVTEGDSPGTFTFRVEV